MPPAAGPRHSSSVPFTGAVPIVKTICVAVLSTSLTLNIALVIVLLIEPSATVMPVLVSSVGESFSAFTVKLTDLYHSSIRNAVSRAVIGDGVVEAAVPEKLGIQ